MAEATGRYGLPTFRRSQGENGTGGGKTDSTVQDLEKLHGEALSARRALEPVWFMNLAYYAGDQWVFWNGGKLCKPKLRADRVLLVDNRIQPAVRRSLAKRTRTRPNFEITPTSSFDDDVYAALLGELAMEDLWHRLYLTQRLRTALQWADITGAGFWKVFWDSEVGAKGEALIGPDGNLLTDQFGRPITGPKFDDILGQLPSEEADLLNGRVKRKAVYEGEIGVEVRSPFQIAPDPLASALDECEYLFEETVKSPDYVKDRFGKDIKPDSQAAVGLLEGRMSSAQIGSATGSFKGVKVKEFWAKPCGKYPQGKHVIWAGKDLLREDDNPYERLPYVMFSGVEVPGRLWPTSITEQMRGPQTELNKVKSQKSENRSRIGNPIMLISKQANVKVHGLPGERVYYDDTTQNAKPDYLQPPEMPAYIQNEVAEIESAMMEISGQHEVSGASVPAGVTAAAAIQLLQEADDTMLGPVIEDQETQLSHAGEMMLELVASKYSTQRKLRIGGPDSEPNLIDFDGAMLKGNTRLRVRTGSSMPQSKAARQAAMTQMLTLFVQNGVPVSERNLRKFFKQYDAGGLEALFGDLSADETQIHREHQRMIAGESMQPDPLVDNMTAHLAGHQEFMKTPHFQKLEADAQQRIRMHTQETQQLIANQGQMQAMNAAAQQQLASAGGGGAGAPEPPDPMDGGPMTLPIFPPREYGFSGPQWGHGSRSQ